MTATVEVPDAIEFDHTKTDPEDGFVLKINGKEYDATDLTLNEVETIEDLCGGVSLDSLDLGRAKTLKAIVFVLLRRDEPEITLEDAGNVKLSGLLGAD